MLKIGTDTRYAMPVFFALLLQFIAVMNMLGVAGLLLGRVVRVSSLPMLMSEIPLGVCG